MQQVSSELFIEGTQDNDENVVVAPIVPGNVQKYAQSHLDREYHEYAVDTSYFTDTGERVMRTSLSTGQNERVVIGNKITKKVVTVTAERANAKPKMPHYKNENANEVLETWQFVPAAPHRVLNEVQIWRASAVYVYKLLVPLDMDTSTFPCGTTPVELETSYDHKYEPTDFDRAITHAAHGVPAGLNLLRAIQVPPAP